MEQAEMAEQAPGGALGAESASDAAALASLLRWYVAMGVDVPIDEEARDGFALTEAAVVPAEPATGRSPPQRAAPQVAVPPHAALSADALVLQAKALAASAANLEDLARAWAVLPGCDLAAKSTGMIFSGGRAGARLMLFGAAPDSDDERQASAFAGAKGRLLDAMLRAIGLTRADVYLAHIVPWRPPGNRPPTPLELSLCLPFARRQIALSAPRLILCLGERTAQPLLDSREPVSRLRGRFLRFEGEANTVQTLVTFSLDYLLKQPLGKRRAWADLQMLAEALDRDAPVDGGIDRLGLPERERERLEGTEHGMG